MRFGVENHKSSCSLIKGIKYGHILISSIGLVVLFGIQLSSLLR